MIVQNEQWDKCPVWIKFARMIFPLSSGITQAGPKYEFAILFDFMLLHDV